MLVGRDMRRRVFRIWTRYSLGDWLFGLALGLLSLLLHLIVGHRQIIIANDPRVAYPLNVRLLLDHILLSSLLSEVDHGRLFRTAPFPCGF